MKSVSLSTLSPLRSLVSMNHHCGFKSGVSILYNPLTFLKVSSAGFQSQTFSRSSFCHKAPDLGLSSGFLLLMENLCDCTECVPPSSPRQPAVLGSRGWPWSFSIPSNHVWACFSFTQDSVSKEDRDMSLDMSLPYETRGSEGMSVGSGNS